jgi:hypothetical protein
VLTIDLDSTICQTYGLQKEGATGFTYNHVRGYHPLLAIAAGTGEVLMARLRGGNANSGRSAGHFLRETIGRVRGAGASGQLTVRADSGFYAEAVVAVCRRLGVRFSITARQHRSMRRLIAAIPEAAWRPIPYWLTGGADVARDRLHPVRLGGGCAAGAAHRAPRAPHTRLPARGVRALRLPPFITDRAGDTLSLEADHRRHAEVENAIRDLKYGVGLNHLPSSRFAANGAWLAIQVMAHNLARWIARIGLGESRPVTTKTLRRRLFGLVGRRTRSARRLTLHMPARWPVAWTSALARLRAIPLLA